jgi:serine/threonine-protein kinase
MTVVGSRCYRVDVKVKGDPMLGKLVGGRYEVVRLMARGGMGAIYEVRNTRLNRPFVVKTLFGEAANQPQILERFRREAEAIAKLHHPNIVEVIDWEVLDDGAPCIVLEYLRGEDLGSRILNEAPLPWAMIALIADETLSALSVAHSVGIVHRDLKPQNVFLATDDSGIERVKLLDFGISKVRDASTIVTGGRLIGTPSYMSPEQAESRTDDVGPATDLWAFAAMLQEMATGEVAFAGGNIPHLLDNIVNAKRASITAKRADAPAKLLELLDEAFTVDVARRISDADVMRVRLREALRDLGDVKYNDASSRRIPVFPLRDSRPHPVLNDTLPDSSDIAMPRVKTYEVPPPRPRVKSAPPPKRPPKRRGIDKRIGAVMIAALAITAGIVVFAASRPEQTTVTVASSGTLEITSLPTGAAISIGGEPSGERTPATLNVSGTSVTIRLEVAEHLPLIDTVEVPAGQHVAKHFILEEMKTGRLVLHHLGLGWVIMVDGLERDPVVQLAPGKHRVQIFDGKKKLMVDQLITTTDDGDQRWKFVGNANGGRLEKF